MKYRWFLCMFLFCSASLIWSCKTKGFSDEEAYMKKQKELYEKQLEKDYQFIIETHQKMQSQSTLDMMKRSRKMSKGLNLKRKKSLFRRFKKCKKPLPLDTEYVEDR